MMIMPGILKDGGVSICRTRPYVLDETLPLVPAFLDLVRFQWKVDVESGVKERSSMSWPPLSNKKSL